MSRAVPRPLAQRVLDPIERTSEVLFGVIMALTFTGSISVADAGREDIREVLVGAIGCNLAWGLVDASMYLMAAFIGRARLLAKLTAIRQIRAPEAARALIVDLLPPALASVVTPDDIERLRQRVNQQAPAPAGLILTRTDFLGAIGVFLLVCLSTFPVVVPLILVHEPRPALRLSNAVAVVMLFMLGSVLGRHAGRSGWQAGLCMVTVGLVLVAITIALGG